MLFVTENIPDGDSVSRCCFSSEGVPLDPESDLQFPTSKANKKLRDPESAIWRKYAPLAADVHARGKLLQDIKNARRAENQRLTYMGAISGIVEPIRAIQTERGYAIDVTHYVEDGDQAHAHLTIRDTTAAARKAEKNDVREIIHLVVGCLSLLESA